MGSLIHFARTGARQNDVKWNDPADNALRSMRNSSDPSLVTRIDAKQRRDKEDDGGDGTAA